MQSILQNWNIIRVIRLLAGIVLLGYGYSIVDWLIILIGFTLSVMAITNSGCNPIFGRSCDTDLKKDIEH